MWPVWGSSAGAMAPVPRRAGATAAPKGGRRCVHKVWISLWRQMETGGQVPFLSCVFSSFSKPGTWTLRDS